jgi:hypothetical protein
MMKAGSTSETSVNFYETTRRNNAEDNHLLHKTSMQATSQTMIQKHIAAQCAAAEPQLHAILCPTVCEE